MSVCLEKMSYLYYAYLTSKWLTIAFIWYLYGKRIIKELHLYGKRIIKVVSARYFIFNNEAMLRSKRLKTYF